MPLHKEVLLGVSGGIAAYKSLEILRKLKEEGFNVQVVMTKAACQFVQPLSFQVLSGRKVAVQLFDEQEESRVEHIAMVERADIILVAPATANILAKMRMGLADDFLSTVLLAATSPIITAPAMNDQMWRHAATQENIEILERRGVRMISPEEGFLACGKTSIGRMADIDKIVSQVKQFFQDETTRTGLNSPLRGVPVLITAGPTREELDPVRYISNYSSGKMGFSLAAYCASQGAKVTLISGPVSIPAPENVHLVNVESAEEMYQAVMKVADSCKLIIKAAAVADYRVKQTEPHKMKKQNSLTIELESTTDILRTLGENKQEGQILVGFAAETENLAAYAKQKLIDKKLDAIVANNVMEEGAGFEKDTNRVLLIDKDREKELPLMTKEKLAGEILNFILELPGW